MLVTTLACAGLGVALPYIGPVARELGFQKLPLSFLLVLAGMIVTYLGLAEVGKAVFFKPRAPRRRRSLARALAGRERRIMRRAARWVVWRQPAAGR